MTNAYPTGGSQLPPYSSNTGASAGVFRRSSYASVAAGTASAASIGFSPPARSGTFPHPANPSSTSPTRHQPQHRPRSSSRHSSRGIEINTQVGSQNMSGSLGKAGQMPSSFSSPHGLYGDSFGHIFFDAVPPFFTPSYLCNSRYVDRLRATHKARAQAHREQLARQTQHNVHRNSLSTSSSSASLHKMAPTSHRGVTHEVVERQSLQATDDLSRGLPSRWNENDKANGLEILADGSEVKFTGSTRTSDDAVAVRSDNPMPKECGLYYYEVTVLSKGKEGLIGIGFSSSKVPLQRLPGWEPESWAYHGDDGYSFACTASGKPYGPRFSTQDVIGCGINFRTGCAFFTKNGIMLGNAFKDVKGDKLLYPSVGMKKPGEHLRVNFGQTPFVFDIDGMMLDEADIVRSEIEKTPITLLHPQLGENALIDELIAQYLDHEGYNDTGRAFAEEVKQMNRSLTNGGHDLTMPHPNEDLHATNRQKIRRAILDGDIDRALKYTTSFFPKVLQDNENTKFKLKCRKFIEMVRKSSEPPRGSALPSPTLAKPSQPSNGYHMLPADGRQQAGGNDVFDHQMELDDQLQRESNPPVGRQDNVETEDVDDMDISGDGVTLPGSSPSPGKNAVMAHSNMLDAVVAYGTELQNEFGKDPRKEVKNELQKLFALIAYTDASHIPSSVSVLLSDEGRMEIADEINGAILVSLGKSSSAALERLVAQSEELVSMLGEDGGAGAFVSVRHDFLR
ncbi:hypothetical protein LTR66_000353 [Elasticomyces elasticus]|nr:hypothetical protein LTR66_000353 [Elasticomyces elasticus]